MDFFNGVIQFFNAVIDFFARLYDYFYSGLYDFVTEVFAQFIIYSTIAAIQFKIFIISFSWDIAQNILSELNISAAINAALGGLNGDIAGVIGLLQIPEALNLILSAYTTRFVMRFMRF